jgi:PEGA domain
VSATPAGADIEIDGNFVGSTPSTVGVAAGPRQFSVKKAGFKPWERKITVSSRHIKIDATLESQANRRREYTPVVFATETSSACDLRIDLKGGLHCVHRDALGLPRFRVSESVSPCMTIGGGGDSRTSLTLSV